MILDTGNATVTFDAADVEAARRLLRTATRLSLEEQSEFYAWTLAVERRLGVPVSTRGFVPPDTLRAMRRSRSNGAVKRGQPRKAIPK